MTDDVRCNKRKLDLNNERDLKKLKLDRTFENVKINLIVDEDNSVWFKGVDVNEALGFKNPNNFLSTFSLHQPHELKTAKSFKATDDSDIPQNALFVSERGLTSYLANSPALKAESLLNWIKDDVLPSIQKSDTYDLQIALRELEDERKLRRETEKTLKRERNERKKKLRSLLQKNQIRIIKLSAQRNLLLSEFRRERREANNQLELLRTENENLKIQYEEEHLKNQKYVFDVNSRTVNYLRQNTDRNPYLAIIVKDVWVLNVDGTINDKAVVERYGGDYYPFEGIRGQRQYVDQKVKELLTKYPKGKLMYMNLDPNPVLKLNNLKEEKKLTKRRNHIKTKTVEVFESKSAQFMRNWIALSKTSR